MDIQSTDLGAGPTSMSVHAGTDAPMQTRRNQASHSAPLLDSRLIVQIGQRDEQALGALYDRYGALVYAIALRSTPDRALADAIVVDVFCAAWQSASSFQVGASVRMWLIGMARRRASEIGQPLRVHPRMHRAARAEKDTLRNDEQSERIADVLNAPGLLDALPADQRETLELAYYDGLTCGEIAARLHQPVSSILTRLRVGLGALSEARSNAEAHVSEHNL